MDVIQFRILASVMDETVLHGGVKNTELFRDGLTPEDIQELSALIQTGFIQVRAPGYIAQLKAVWSLARRGGELGRPARAIVADCETLLKKSAAELNPLATLRRKRLRENKQGPSALSDLAVECELPQARLDIALRFLGDLSWVVQVGQDESGKVVSVSPMERAREFDSLDGALAGAGLLAVWTNDLDWDLKTRPYPSDQSGADDEYSTDAFTEELGGDDNASSSEPPSPALDDEIVKALVEINPLLAATYRQAVHDLEAPSRESFVGPAAEMREVISWVLRELAPDRALEAQPGWQGEADKGRPSRRQRSAYILTTKLKGKPGCDTALAMVNAGLDGLAGDLYERASKPTHRPDTDDRRELKRLLSYLNGLLSDLLL